MFSEENLGKSCSRYLWKPLIKWRAFFLEVRQTTDTHKGHKVKNLNPVPIRILRIPKCIDDQEAATIRIFKSNFIPGGKNINN